MYVITAVPALAPLTIPDPDPTDATDGLLLLHVPPVTLFVIVVVVPTHIAVVVAVIAAGVGFTVTRTIVLPQMAPFE